MKAKIKLIAVIALFLIFIAVWITFIRLSLSAHNGILATRSQCAEIGTLGTDVWIVDGKCLVEAE